MEEKKRCGTRKEFSSHEKAQKAQNDFLPDGRKSVLLLCLFAPFLWLNSWLVVAVAFLAFLLRGFGFAWSCSRWGRCFDLGCCDFRFWLRRRWLIVGLRRWRQSHLFQFRFSCARRQRLFILGLFGFSH